MIPLFCFFRPTQHNQEKRDGLGRLFFSVADFAAAHGGDIRVSSIVGKGTTFTVTLPKQG